MQGRGGVGWGAGVKRKQTIWLRSCPLAPVRLLDMPLLVQSGALWKGAWLEWALSELSEQKHEKVNAEAASCVCLHLRQGLAVLPRLPGWL